MMALNLGCGPRLFPKPWLNADRLKGIGADVVMDINAHWPWVDETFDQVFANHVLEHGWDKVHLISELWRISKPGALIQVRLPIHTWPQFWDDPGHRSCWTANSFMWYDVTSPGHTAQPYKHIEFTIERFALRDGWELAWDLIVIKVAIQMAEPPIVVPQKGAAI